MSATCFYCGKQINPDGPGVHRQMMGWAKPPDRPAGKYADIEAREPQEEFACSLHVRRIKQGLSPVQEALSL